MRPRTTTPVSKTAAQQTTAVVAICFVLGGCALGPIASFDGGTYSEVRGHSCNALAIERQQHVARIATLEGTMAAELAKPPTTLAQALQRMGDSPQVGTDAYAELTSEQTRLEANRVEAMRIPCPAEVAKLP